MDPASAMQVKVAVTAGGTSVVLENTSSASPWSERGMAGLPNRSGRTGSVLAIHSCYDFLQIQKNHSSYTFFEKFIAAMDFSKISKNHSSYRF